MGGKPNKGTPADKRLKGNKDPKPKMPAMPMPKTSPAAPPKTKK